MAKRIDTHIHLYDPASGTYAWPPKGDQLLYRRYAPEDFARATANWHMDGLVLIGCSSEPEMTESVLRLFHDDPRVAAIVGQIDIDSPDFPRVFENAVRYEKFRGFRTSLKPVLSETAKKHLAMMEASRAHVIELMANQDALDALAPVYDAYPGITFVLEHYTLQPIDGQEPPARWTDFLARMAKHPNTCLKVSSAMMRTPSRPSPEDPAFYLPAMRACIRAFGAKRCMFGSDWPVIELCGTYDTAIKPAEALRGELGEEDWAYFMGGSAEALYGL